MSFNLKRELAKQNGAVLDLPTLKDMIFGLRLANMQHFAPEIGVHEILEMALNNGWVVERLDLTAPYDIDRRLIPKQGSIREKRSLFYIEVKDPFYIEVKDQ